MKLIEFDKVKFSYAKDKDRSGFILDIDGLSVSDGEFISILGPNGCGKSTLLKLITGLLKPDSGDVRLNNLPVKKIEPKELAKLVGFVPQTSYSIYPYSVYEIVMMGRTSYLNFFGYEKSEDKSIVENALETVGISSLAYKGINEVSGGEAQRAFIARALVQQPKIILLDEPNAHLDVSHQISIFNLLKDLNESQGLTVLSVSHDLNLSAYYSSRVILMKSGRIVEDGSVNGIMNRENIRKVFGINSQIEEDEVSGKLNILIRPDNVYNDLSQ